jgi:hypothetical protein
MSCDGRIQTFLEALASALYVDADGNVHINTEILQTDCEDITPYISSMLLCNLTRTDTGTDDTWATNTSGNLPLILEVDFHYPIDTLGSRTSSSK